MAPVVGVTANLHKKLGSGFLLCLVSVMVFYIEAGTRRYSNAPAFNLERVKRNPGQEKSEERESIGRLRRKHFDGEYDSRVRERNQLYAEYLQMVTRLENNSTKSKRLPNVIGVGAEKCGSGALRWMLLKHPMMLSSKPAEMHYFGRWKSKRTIEDYLMHMPMAAPYELIFEKTPSYFTLDAAASSIRETIPNAKILLVLCDPVNRTFSDYVQEKIIKKIVIEESFENLTRHLMDMFSVVLKKRGHDPDATLDYIQKMFRRYRPSHILTTGLYFYHFQKWLKVFGLSNIHVVDGEELISNPGLVMEKVQDFLQIPRLVIQEDFVKGSNGFYCYDGPKIRKNNSETTLVQLEKPECLKHSSKGRTRMGNWHYKPSEDAVNALRRFYEPQNEKLFALLGREFNWTKHAH